MACWRCGLVFSYPQPDGEALAAYYASSGKWRADRTIADAAAAQTKGKGAAGRVMLEILDTHVPPGSRRVLDFGCGTGGWLNVLQDHGWETFGIEPSTDVAFVRHRRLDTIPDDGRFDLVMAYHVLEHLPRPLDALRQLAAAVRIGGYAFASVPRLDAVGVHRDLTYCLYPPHHIVAFTEGCLRGLFAAAGFKVVAALHELDGAFTKGVPLRLRLLARRVPETKVCPDPSPVLKALLADLAPILATVAPPPPGSPEPSP